MNNESFSYTQPLLETPFHSKTREKCHAHDWYRWAGYKIVRQYTSAELEYTAIRNTAGVIDITPMHKYKIKGSQAKAFVNKLITRDISSIKNNQIVYAMWCNEDGYIVDDGTIFCFNENDFTFCCAERNLNWFDDTAIGYDVIIEDISKTIAALAFQGPLSCKILHMLGAKEIEISARISYLFKKFGAEGDSYDPIIASGWSWTLFYRYFLMIMRLEYHGLILLQGNLEPLK